MASGTHRIRITWVFLGSLVLELARAGRDTLVAERWNCRIIRQGGIAGLLLGWVPLRIFKLVFGIITECENVLKHVLHRLDNRSILLRLSLAFPTGHTHVADMCSQCCDRILGMRWFLSVTPVSDGPLERLSIILFKYIIRIKTFRDLSHYVSQILNLQLIPIEEIIHGRSKRVVQSNLGPITSCIEWVSLFNSAVSIWTKLGLPYNGRPAIGDPRSHGVATRAGGVLSSMNARTCNKCSRLRLF